MKHPFVYDVDKIRDGGSFTTRRVVAIQKGEPIFNMSSSFHKKESGPIHQIDMPDIPGPEECISELEQRKKIIDKVDERFREYFTRERPIEMRNLPGEGMFEDATGEGTNTWNSAGITDPNNSNMGYLKVTTKINIISD